MKRLIIYLAVLLLPVAVQAQVAKQVEVEKDYTPSVSVAQKLAIMPDMTDTVMMRPEIDYSFMPRSYETSLMTENFKPATIAYWDFVRSKLLYAKAGLAVPMESEADVYVSSYRKDRGYAMAYLNHWGDYRNRMAMDGKSVATSHSMQMSNRIGGRAGLFLGRRQLEVDIYGDNQLRHRYPSTGERIAYGDVNGKIRIGDDFADLSRWNFNVEAGGKLYGHNARLADKGKFAQNNLFAKAAVGKKHFRIHAGFEGAYGQGAIDTYQNNILMAGARYGFGRERFDFVVGADYYYDRVGELTASPHHVFPYMRMTWQNAKQSFVPFVEVEGGVKHNDFASLSYINPYMVASEDLAIKLSSLQNEALYNGRAGFGGNLGKGIFSYNLSAELSIANGHAYWYNRGADYMFELAYQHSLRLNGNMVFRPSGWFAAEIAMGAYVWENYDDFYSSRPNFDLDVKLKYTGRRLSIGANMEVQGGIKWMTLAEQQAPAGMVPNFTYVQTPATLVVGLDAEWRINEHWGVYAEARNLTGSKIYEWLCYYNDSVQGLVGVKYSF